MAALEFTRRYSMAHRLRDDMASKCATPHGHNEIVTIRLAPAARFRFGGSNMLTSFDRAKGRWKRWIDEAVDHALMLDTADPLVGYFQEREPERLGRLMIFPGDPTTEALSALFFLKLDAFLKADELPFTVDEVRVEETPTNAVSLTCDLFDPATAELSLAWPRRADMSINDF